MKCVEGGRGGGVEWSGVEWSGGGGRSDATDN